MPSPPRELEMPPDFRTLPLSERKDFSKGTILAIRKARRVQGLYAEISKNIQPLIEKGVIFSTQSLEFTYTKLPEERVAMLGDAIKDAKARAASLAQSSGKLVGQLKSASSGVVQVTSANSTDVSDYGFYDTSKIEKNIMMTVKASFTLK